MKLGIVIYSADSETIWNAFRLGNFALGQQDQVFYLRNIAIAQSDPALLARYGTVADSYAFGESSTRGNVINGPIPIHPGDLSTLRKYLLSSHAEPPEDE